jgi:hypothetical protein
VPPAWCRPTSACSLTPLRVDEIVPILNVGINRNAVPIDLAARLMRQAFGVYQPLRSPDDLFFHLW